MDVARNPQVGDRTPEAGVEIDLTVTDRPDLHDVEAREHVERQLRSIPGVIAVRLVPGYDREVDELHVVTTLDRSPRSTVRDVQTVLLARCGVSIDHRVISVAHVEQRQIPRSVPRVALVGVGATRTHNRVVAEVTLALGGADARGTAEGAATTGGHHRAVAHATLAALHSLLDTELTIELHDATITSIAGQQLAIALIELRDSRGEELRTGCALAGDPAADAIARSILAALNRAVGQPGR